MLQSLGFELLCGQRSKLPMQELHEVAIVVGVTVLADFDIISQTSSLFLSFKAANVSKMAPIRDALDY